MFKRSLVATIPVALGLACTAEAAVITVDTFTNSFGCTLEAALAAAENNRRVRNCVAGEAGVVDEIRFQPGLYGTFTLRPSTLITDSVRIIGNGRNRTVIDGGLVIDTGAEGEFAVRGVQMRRGLILWGAREITVEGVRFAELRDQMVHGSAIATPMAIIGRLSIIDSEFLRNPGKLGVVALSSGAQIGEVEIRRSRFIGNHTYGFDQGSGALYIGAKTAQVSIVATDFVGNSSATGMAGAIVVEQPTWLSIEASVFDGNESLGSGAIWLDASELDIVNSSLTRNRGDDAGAVYLQGGSYFGLRFSAVVDNDSSAGAPALNLDFGPGWVSFLANVLRAPLHSRVCGWAPVHSQGFNQEYQGNTCNVSTWSDLANLSFPLASALAGAGRPRVPMPGQYGPGRDRVPFDVCALSSQEPLTVDIRGLERPWSHGQVDPYGWCDVGPVEQRPEDFPAPNWHPSMPPYFPGTSP